MAEDDKTESAPAPAADDGRPLAERVGKIETEQERQGGILAEIRDHLTGRADPVSGEPVTTGDNPAASAADMADQMRQAVRDVNAEAAAAASTSAPAKPEPETTPREVMIKGKDRLQRVLFGSEPKR